MRCTRSFRLRCDQGVTYRAREKLMGWSLSHVSVTKCLARGLRGGSGWSSRLRRLGLGLRGFRSLPGFLRLALLLRLLVELVVARVRVGSEHASDLLTAGQPAGDLGGGRSDR